MEVSLESKKKAKKAELQDVLKQIEALQEKAEKLKQAEREIKEVAKKLKEEENDTEKEQQKIKEDDKHDQETVEQA